MMSFLGKNPDALVLRERQKLAGQWVALERYNPENLALRRIAAIGSSPESCQEQLRTSGKDPEGFHFEMLRPPF